MLTRFWIEKSNCIFRGLGARMISHKRCLQKFGNWTMESIDRYSWPTAAVDAPGWLAEHRRCWRSIIEAEQCWSNPTVVGRWRKHITALVVRVETYLRLGGVRAVLYWAGSLVSWSGVGQLSTADVLASMKRWFVAVHFVRLFVCVVFISRKGI
jgi:hypothetical protein